MAPRKAELLDLMRKQRAASGQRPAEAPRPAPQPAPADEERRRPARPRRSASARASRAAWPLALPWASLALALLLVVPLVWWLVGALGGGQPVEAGGAAGVAAAAARAAGDSASAPPPAESAAAAAPSYGVVAIQYDRTAANVERAVQVAKELVGLLGLDYHLGQVLEYGDWIRIYFGRSDRADDPELASLRERLAGLEYPPGSGRHEFRTAYVARIPVTR
ncbi:MAG: hypothetical protein D6702_02780 [Planctomycetota bacterium]|nr:MAG: hypothetical protein D6702_02780 [Planctomycetota bacterium]